MACPFFVPRAKVNDGSWPHPERLPLGAGWTGNCRVLGPEIFPADSQIRECCNLGYASTCPHLPSSRDWDAIRFSVAHVNGDLVTIWFVCEFDNAPIEYGKLTFDLRTDAWLQHPPDPRVHTLATSYLQAYRGRQRSAIESL